MHLATRERAAKFVKRLAWLSLVVPTAVLALGLLPQLLPGCAPQMYGVGECVVGTVNVAPYLLAAVGFGVYGLAMALPVVFLPLRVVAWWLERGHRSAA